MAKITFNISDEECQQLNEEAAVADTKVATYVSSIVSQRNQKAITIQSSDEKLIGRMEGQIEAQDAQINRLTEQLTRSSEKAGLAGLEKRNNVNETTLQEYGQKIRQEIQNDMDQRELVELRLHKTQSDARIQELEDHKASNDKFDKALSGIKEVVNSNPVILTSLLGMVGMKMPGEDVPGLSGTPEDERALRIGRAVVNDIDPTIQDELMVVLNHLSKAPADIAAILRTKPFADARKLAMAQTSA